MIESSLGLGPMSSEIIEAVFRTSHNNRKELMLIASKNQIDYNRGYVNNWTTKEYIEFISKMKEKYSKNKVLICRDHCGPGFNGIYDLEDTYRTIKEDIASNFDLIHVDLCYFKGTIEEKLKESKKAIEYILKLNPKMKLEIGTEENSGENVYLSNLEKLEQDIDFFREFCKLEFYVVPTGSLVKEINQVGNFNKEFVGRVSMILKSGGLKLKEHNADYLSKEEISMRKGLVNAMNIAPQLGAVHTTTVLKKCLMYGINFNDFLEEVYKGKRWKKWMHTNSPENKFLCSVIAGHYHFSSENYKKLIGGLEKREDIHETIINEIIKVIKHYENNN